MSRRQRREREASGGKAGATVKGDGGGVQGKGNGQNRVEAMRSAGDIDSPLSWAAERAQIASISR